MKRYKILFTTLHRQIKESELYHTENKNRIREIAQKIENEKKLSMQLFNNISSTIIEMGSRETMYSILCKFNEKNNKITAKFAYLELYKFLKRENLYTAYILRIREIYPYFTNLREYIIKVMQVGNPINLIRFTVFSYVNKDLDDEAKAFWGNVNEKWNEHLAQLLKENI